MEIKRKQFLKGLISLAWVYKDLHNICLTKALKIKRKSFTNFPLLDSLLFWGHQCCSLFITFFSSCPVSVGLERCSFPLVLQNHKYWGISMKVKKGSALLRPFPDKYILGAFLWSTYTYKKMFSLKLYLTRLHQFSIFWKLESHYNIPFLIF